MARTSRRTNNHADFDTPIKADKKCATAIYARLSVEDLEKQTASDSIRNQVMLLKQYLEGKSEFELFDIYADDGFSGTNYKRPAYQRLTRDIEAGNVQCVLVKDLSRLGRNLIETGYIIEDYFPAHNVRFIAVNDFFDSDNAPNAGDSLMIPIKNFFNDNMAKETSRKVSDAKRRNQQKGLFAGSFAPYGYLKSGKHALVIDEEAAPVVRDIFNWYAERQGYLAIARKLNEAGILSPNHYRYQKGIFKAEKFKTATWDTFVVNRILTNPMYVGHMAQGKQHQALYANRALKKVAQSDWIIVKNTHDAIISEGLFNTVQTMIQAKAARLRPGQNEKRNNAKRTENIFKGLIFCANCGRRVARTQHLLAAGKVAYDYKCDAYIKTLTAACKSYTIREETLKKAVFESIQAQIRQMVDKQKMIDKITKSSDYQTRLADITKRIRQTEQRLKRLKTLKDSLYEEYADTLLTEREYLAAKRKYEQDIETAQNEIDHFNREQKRLSGLSKSNGWLATLKKFEKQKELTRDMVEAVVKRILLYPGDKLEIEWNFRDEYAAVLDEMGVAV